MLVLLCRCVALRLMVLTVPGMLVFIGVGVLMRMVRVVWLMRFVFLVLVGLGECVVCECCSRWSGLLLLLCVVLL